MPNNFSIQANQFKKQFQNGRLAQSFLVSGPQKTGKFRMVVEMIGLVNNLNKDQQELVSNGQMADIILIETEVAQNEREKFSDTSQADLPKAKKLKDTITKKQVDEAMKNINLKNFQLDKKNIIIKDAEKMTNTATNSLLKLIEEPDDNLIIFLLVNNEEEILATIRSRCQNIRFSFMDDEQIKNIIQKEYSLDDEISKEIIGLASGRIELARQYAENSDQIKLAKEVREKFRQALRKGKLEQIKLVEELTKSDKDLLWIMNEWIWYLKNFLEENIKNEQSVGVIKKIYFILDSLLKTRDNIKTTNVSKKVQLENFFVQI